MRANTEPIIVEEFFNTSISTVWNAITEVGQMRKWFFANIECFKPEIGFETRFVIQVEDRIYPHLWKLTEVTPMKKITYDWRYEGYPGSAIVAFELIEIGNQAKLILTATVVESFPENIPEFTRESCIEGWNYFIKKSLKTYLETE